MAIVIPCEYGKFGVAAFIRQCVFYMRQALPLI